MSDMIISKDIIYIGADDKETKLFESFGFKNKRNRPTQLNLTNNTKTTKYTHFH